jgi:FkbM family methyltransferase
MFSRVKEIIVKIIKSEKPVRFIFSRILMRLRISQLIIIKRNNYKIKFYPTWLSRTCFDRRIYYKYEEEEFLSRYLKKGDIYIDIGANIGLFALKAASIIGNNGSVFAVEPMPKIFKYLYKNVKFNGFQNVKLYKYAIGDSVTNTYLTDIKYDDTINAILPSGGLKVEQTTMDTLFNELVEKINLLKVDVEGYEIFVFRGAKNILKRTDCVFFESWENHFSKFNYCTEDLFRVLINSGFHIYKLINDRLEQLSTGYKSTECEDLIALKDIDNFLRRFNSNIGEIRN